MKAILFVCGNNAGRSQMSEAFLNRMAHDRDLDVRSQSAVAGTVDNVTRRA